MNAKICLYALLASKNNNFFYLSQTFHFKWCYFITYFNVVNSKNKKQNLNIMKKYIIMALLAVAFSPACKKDKNTPACKPANELIRNTWGMTGAKVEYFNEANNTAATDAVAEQPPKYIYEITADRIRRIDPVSKNPDFDNRYTFTDNVITFKDAPGETGTEQKYEVTNLTSDKMQWRQVKDAPKDAPITYTTSAGTTGTATKQVTTIDFTAQPQSK